MRKVTIGLLGAVLSNSNLGCVALTLSLLKILEEIATDNGLIFDYYVFEARRNTEASKTTAELIGVDRERIHSFQVSSLYSVSATVKHPTHAIDSYKAISKCSFFVDLTAGDSFTDIYGQNRFDGTTKLKELVEKKGIPLILGPQTYGPFNKEENRMRAKSVIEKAVAVFARDQLSADYVKSFSDANVNVTTDLAFALPFNKREQFQHDKINVGVNISSLLISNKTETTKTEFEVKANYDFYIKLLLSELKNNDAYRVFIVPHVGEDGGFAFKEEFPGFIYLPPFKNPIAAKEFISGLDIFVGSRMHATIAAFSSGVATIPVAYSRKFLGLYGSLGYQKVIDLQAIDEQNAFEQTMRYVRDYEQIRAEQGKYLTVAESKQNEMKTVLSQIIKEVISA